MPLNLHKVFSGAPEKDYISALNLKEVRRETLRAARDKIRSALRSAFADLSKYSSAELFESAVSIPKALRPVFRMQGSFAYHTCNDPAQKPPQEVDLDDGMFLPVSYLHANGGNSRPSLLSKALFEVVERTLKPVCDENGWRLKQKPSCVRVCIDREAHVDVALYSIPDSDYSVLLETALQAQDSAIQTKTRDALAHDELPDQVYRQLARAHIMLAHRVEGWKPSDPRKLEDWFRDAVEEHGDHLRRICRYLKGWRDYSWDECRLSSIILMAATVRAFEAKPDLANLGSRDDKVLLAVSAELSGILARPIPNPVVPGLFLDENWSPELRQEYVDAAGELLVCLQAALLNNSANIALAELRNSFGDRMPNDSKLVSEDGGLELKSVVSAPMVGKAAADEQLRRAEIAAREIEARGQQSKPWRGRD